ncbi:hypothetical protein B0T21DRAFT_380690 [Apiosordaria backusii]|uniref:Uncharacterized protein n=1 Tax=Apiosordaria backusii TaxID=314023 RepID=A0AA40K3C1_9PEZI|nr:hypothetical protein B0T21DRAFT_380690 [Apiosordaria backusii]
MSGQSPKYLFRPARQASLPPSPSTSTLSTSPSSFSVTRTTASVSSSTTLDLQRRQAAGTCRADESTCPQAGWCCNKDETCSLEGGAFFCCPSGAGREGCIRVCAAGDFQCGGTSPGTTGICCANGQTCIGGDTPLPFCANTGTSSSRRTTTSRSTTTSQPSTSSHSHSHIPTTTASLPTGSGLPIPAQIAAIIAPLLLVTLIAACLIRHRRKKQRGTRIQSTDFTEQQQNNGSGTTVTGTGTGTGTGTITTADGLSFYSAYSSYPKTPPPPPPTFSAANRVYYGREAKGEEEEEGEVMSLHERYMMESRMFRTQSSTTLQSAVGEGGVGRGL